MHRTGDESEVAERYDVAMFQWEVGDDESEDGLTMRLAGPAIRIEPTLGAGHPDGMTIKSACRVKAGTLARHAIRCPGHVVSMAGRVVRSIVPGLVAGVVLSWASPGQSLAGSVALVPVSAVYENDAGGPHAGRLKGARCIGTSASEAHRMASEGSSPSPVQETAPDRQPPDARQPAAARTASRPGRCRSIRLIYSSDTRGNLLPCVKNGVGWGGLPLRRAWLARLRRGRSTLLVSAGNFLFPGHLGVLDEGRTLIGCFDMTGYDAVGVGEADLELGIDVLRDRAFQANFPVVCSNIVNKGAAFVPVICADGRPPERGTTFPLCPACIVRKGELAFGILSVIGKDVVTVNQALRKKVDIISPVETVNKLVPVLKRSGADVILVTCASGFDDAVAIAGIDGVDCVLRTRSALRTSSLKRLDDCRLEDGTAILSLPRGDVQLGYVDLRVDERGASLGPARLVRVDDSIRPDEALEELIEAHERRLIRRYSGQLAELDSGAAHAFPSICADVAREALDTEIAVINRGFFQCEVVRGPLRMIDLLKAMPFGDRLVKLRIKGSDLEKILSKHRDELVTAGLAEVKGKWTVNGRLLESAVAYSVATVSFLARGGGGIFDPGLVSPGDMTGIVFRKRVRERLSRIGRIAADTFRYLWRRPVNVFVYEVTTSFSRINTNENVADYAGNAVPGLATSSATKARGALDFMWTHDRPRSNTITTVKTKYEELDEQRTLDQLTIGLLHERKNSLEGSRPFISMELDTTLTSSSLDGGDRPYKFKIGGGYGFEPSRYLKMRFGVSSLHLFGSLEDDTTVGSDITVEYVREHPKRGITVSSRANHFLSYSGNTVNQLKWENALRIRLIKNLSFSLRYDAFLYNSDNVGSTARSSEFYFGIVYDLARRRF